MTTPQVFHFMVYLTISSDYKAYTVLGSFYNARKSMAFNLIADLIQRTRLHIHAYVRVLNTTVHSRNVTSDDSVSEASALTMGASRLIDTGSATTDDDASETSALTMGASGLIEGGGGAVAQPLMTVCQRRPH